jgi:hypothetical protein
VSVKGDVARVPLESNTGRGYDVSCIIAGTQSLLPCTLEHLRTGELLHVGAQAVL